MAIFERQKTGSVVCPSCGRLVGVNDERCFGCGRWNPGLWGWAPLVSKMGRDLGFGPLVIGVCGTLYVLTLLFSGGEIAGKGILGFLSPSGEALTDFGMSGAVPVFINDRWWTILTAGWLHGSLLHIFFNLMVLRQLVPVVAELFGVGRLVIIYVVSSAMGFAVTSVVGYAALRGFLPIPPFLAGAPFTIGASAALFGLFGALVLYGQRTGRQVLSQGGIQYLVVFVIIGFIVQFIDNWAHIGGFAGGWLAARWLDPLHEENPSHYLGAFACLGLTALAFVVTIIDSLRSMPPLGG